MSLKKGDKVIVIAGKDKGNNGKIVKIVTRDNKVIVEGINMVKKHLKPNANNKNGGIISKEAPIHISNVMLLDPKTNKGTRKRIETEKVAKVEKKEVKKEIKEVKETKKVAKKAKEKQD